jgi:hypothetical protein
MGTDEGRRTVRKRLARCIAVALVAVLAPWVGSARSSAAPVDGSGPLVPVPGVDSAALPDADVEPALRAAIGVARYGGAWIDRTGPRPVFRVGVVGATAADAAAVDRVTGVPEHSATVDRTYAMVDLDRFNEAARGVLDDLGVPYEIDSQEATGTVTVAVPAVPEGLPDALGAAGVPADAVEIHGGFVAPQPGHSSGNRYPYPPYHGGLYVEVRHSDGSASGCTSWFTAGLVNTTDFKGFTAGHCDESNQSGSVWMGSPIRRVSDTGPNSRWPTQPVITSDAVRYNIPDSAATAQVQENSGHRNVSAPIYTIDGPNVGTRICFQGVRTWSRGDANCGDVLAENVIVSDSSGNRYTSMWKASVDADHGDSGGPVYRVMSDGTARPAGMVILVATGGPHYFNHVRAVLGDHGDTGIVVACVRPNC